MSALEVTELKIKINVRESDWGGGSELARAEIQSKLTL